MTETLFLGLYILSIIGGVWVGQLKDQLVSGIVWTLLLSWVGFIILLFLPNRRQMAEDEANTLIEYQKFHQAKAQQERQMKSAAAHEALRIARGGQDLGTVDLPRIKLMLRQGELSMQDFYFDDIIGDWQPLDLHPELSGTAV